MPVETRSAENDAMRNDAMRHSARIREMMTEIIGYLRNDVRDVSDPKAKALFETTAETLLGTRKEFGDFEKGAEAAWRKAS